MRALIAGLLFITTLPLQAGLLSGDFDNRKGGVAIRVVRPPERFLSGKTMQVKIGSAPKSFHRQIELLSAVERALSAQFVRVESGEADVIFEIDVIAYEPPAIREYEVRETQKVQIGETPLYNKDGTPKKNLFGGHATQPIYQEQVVPVGYWEGKGRLAIRLSARPQASSAAVDSASATAQFSEKHKIGESAASPSLNVLGHDIGSVFGLMKRPPQEQVRPTTDSLDLQFIEQVSATTGKRFAKTVNEVGVVLSSEASLAAGTAQALTGDWPGAIQTWDQATLKNSKAEWMRQYNLGLGHVALAFHTYDQGEDAATAASIFERAGQHLLKASSLKPKEKHVTAALQQYASFKAAIQNMSSETAVREAREKRALDEIAAKQKKVLLDKRPDSAKESSFRQLVALRIRGAKGPLPGDERSSLETLGQKAYGLTSAQSQRIVFQENDRITSAAASVETYEQLFATLVDRKSTRLNSSHIL